MKIALVHDYLNQYGGAERVLETLCEIFPDAPIFTLIHDEEKSLGRFKNKIEGTSFLNRKFVARNHRMFIPLMPFAASQMNIGKEYDVILSASAGYAKGMNFHPESYHIFYCYTPLRYAWEYHKYFNWHPAVKLAASPVSWYLRNWDFRAAQKPDKILAVSNYISGKIKDYYSRDSEVLYPPVDTKIFYKEKNSRPKGYFLAAGRLMHYKRFDLIIEAFNKLNLPLLITGDGPELKNLQSLVRSPKIDFIPFVPEGELRKLYNEAEALIFPQVEDFGLVAAEAQACGTPVIAFNGGGAAEIVKGGTTGIFFEDQSPESLALAVKRFLLSSFDGKEIEKSAQRFAKSKFTDKILKIVKQHE
ncbi:MAG: glycosyltransferase [Candidatus Pacebacteria bacterium]|nr:glycosyltransferase [Candidatus Paceibacterota bacterium]